MANSSVCSTCKWAMQLTYMRKLQEAYRCEKGKAWVYHAPNHKCDIGKYEQKTNPGQ